MLLKLENVKETSYHELKKKNKKPKHLPPFAHTREAVSHLRYTVQDPAF